MTFSDRAKILIVDDDESSRQVLKVRLGHDGFDVYEAVNGKEALPKALESEPDVILLDLGLPDIDGLTVLQQFKSNLKICTVPVIIVSGRTQSDFVIKGLDYGAADYVTKPFDMAELGARLRAAGRAKRDLDTIEEVNQRLQEARRQAVEATRSKSEFLANMSHEIRTPLTAILGYAELAYQSAKDHPEIQSDIQIVRTNGKYLLDLINDILDLAKIEAGKLEVERLDCSVVEIVAQVAAIMRVRAVEKGINLETVYEGKIPRTVQSDPTRIRQALINLVSNAIKFTRSGGVTIVVKLVNVEAAPMIEFKVSDTGVGIAQERLEAIFEPFTQADNSTTRNHGGTGLGLAITRRIVEALRGNISVESEPEKGSTFAVQFPTGPLEGVELLDDPEAEGVKSNSQDDSPVEEDRYFKGKVLLAEDTPANQKLVQRMLQKVGLQVDVVDNGKSACEAVEAGQYDVVLMDLHMPILDGMEATRSIRGFNTEIPIVALTADAVRESRDKCLNSGFCGYLTKPIDSAELFSELAKYLVRAEKPRSTQDEPRQVRAEARADEPGEQAGLKVMDPDSAMQRMQMDLETYLEALDETIPWLKQQQEDLLRAIECDDLEAAGMSAHAIKSASGTIGIERLHEAAKDLEQTAKGRQHGDIRKQFDELTQRLAEATEVAQNYLAERCVGAGEPEGGKAPDSDVDMRAEMESLKAQLSQALRRVDHLIKIQSPVTK